MSKASLILGGVKSGKSRLAEERASRSGCAVRYVATATNRGDAEMQSRIEVHRRRRPAHWQTLEVPVHLAAALREHAREDGCLLVDCLTLWLTNLLCDARPGLLREETEALIKLLPQLPGRIILVSNETGFGVIPMGELSRRFVDEAGVLHQRLAEHCDEVILTVAGLPHYLKGKPDER